MRRIGADELKTKRALKLHFALHARWSWQGREQAIHSGGCGSCTDGSHMAQGNVEIFAVMRSSCHSGNIGKIARDRFLELPPFGLHVAIERRQFGDGRTLPMPNSQRPRLNRSSTAMAFGDACGMIARGELENAAG